LKNREATRPGYATFCILFAKSRPEVGGDHHVDVVESKLSTLTCAPVAFDLLAHLDSLAPLRFSRHDHPLPSGRAFSLRIEERRGRPPSSRRGRPPSSRRRAGGPAAFVAAGPAAFVAAARRGAGRCLRRRLLR